MSINVNREVTDIFYRYKMPPLLAKVEGKGNGIKTVVANMVDIAKALNRPPTYPTKYFGCELGAQTQFDFKNERYIVNGAHEAVRLQDLLDGFIKKFVLCSNCENPETDLEIRGTKKNQLIRQRCLACGHIGNIDMTHRLSQFICKNPPDVDGTGTANANTSDVKTKGRGRGKKTGGGDTSPTPNGAPGGGNAQASNSDAPAPEEGLVTTGMDEVVAAAEQGPIPSTNAKGSADDWDDDWAAEGTIKGINGNIDASGKNAVVKDTVAVVDELAPALKHLVMNPDLEKSQAERVDMFFKFIQKKKAANPDALIVPTIASDAGAKEIHREAQRLDIVDSAPLVLVEILIKEAGTLKQIEGYRRLFLMKNFLKAFELFFSQEMAKAKKATATGTKNVSSTPPSSIRTKIPHILKALYDHDIVEEDVLLDWDRRYQARTAAGGGTTSSSSSSQLIDTASSKMIHDAAAKFIEWLQDAEEESSEESDDDGGGVQIGAAPAAPVATAVKSTAAARQVAEDDEDDDEVDIDAL